MADNTDHPSGPDDPDGPSPPSANALAAPSVRPTQSAWSNPAVQAGAAIAAIVVIALVGTIALGSNDDSASTRSSAALDDAETTTTLPTTTYCKMELAGWLDYALAPGGSLSAAGAEFGFSSPEYTAVETAWSKFAENTYVVGADKASTIAVESLAADCDTIGDSYVPGHIAPN